MRLLRQCALVACLVLGTSLTFVGTAHAGANCHNSGGVMYDCDLTQWSEMGSHFETTMNLSLSDFYLVKYLGYYKDARLDWSTDGCSNAPPGVGTLYNFQMPCERHDFCYRNSKAFGNFITPGLLVPDVKDSCDNRFLQDMQTNCASSSNVGACYSVAQTYYNMVVAFG